MWTHQKLLLYVLSCISLFTPNSTYAQNITDSCRSDGLRIGIDVIKLGSSIFSKNDFQVEFIAQCNRNKHLFLVEAGSGNRTATVGNYNEVSKGAYIRLGYEQNFIKKGNDIFAIGGRISSCFFQHQARDLNLGDNYWGQYTATLPATNDFLAWFEVTSSVKVDLAPFMGIGFTVRLQKKLFSTYQSEFEPSYIAGYGKTNSSFSPAMNYFVYFHLPFKKYRISESTLAPKK